MPREAGSKGKRAGARKTSVIKVEVDDQDSFTTLPPLARICIISFLGNDVVSLDTAMTNKVGREELDDIYPECELKGMVLPTDPLPAWNDESKGHHQRICLGLQWAKKKGIEVKDFALDLKGIPEGKSSADHLWLLIHRRVYAMAAEVIKRCSSYDINKSNNRYLRTPLAYAVNDPDASELVRLLCAREDVHLNCRDRVGRTPCMWAAINAAPVCLGILLESGAELMLKDKNGETALHFAALGGNLACVKLLVEKNASVNALDKSLHTPLKLARNDVEVFDYLRSRGAELSTLVVARRRAARLQGKARDSDDSDDELGEG